MRIHLNFVLNGEEKAWSVHAGRKLFLINKTGRSGSVLDNINLGFYRNGRKSYIFLNNPSKRPSSKTVGIFVWPDSYTADGISRFLGKTKTIDGDIVGMYGVYDIGTIIHTREGSEWELTKEGWVQTMLRDNK